MPKLDAKSLAHDMLNAAKPLLQGHWKAVGPYAESEMQKLAVTALQIEVGQMNGSLTSAQAQILLKMQANASQSVLTAVETVGMIAAQDAINAALDVLRDALNKAVGVAFL
ncbi:MAG: hypothetical protein ABJB09_01025 [Verrucomicrobiota bacterium]